jgi:hypothetical protein
MLKKGYVFVHHFAHRADADAVRPGGRVASFNKPSTHWAA